MRLTKRQTWLFFLGGTALCTMVFIGLTLDFHAKVGKLTNDERLTPQVKAGMEVWHTYNCVNCHTILGEGAYFAPDLTKISQHRGEQYLKLFMKNPSQFYNAEEVGRVMPTLPMSEQEIDDVVAFLTWVSGIDTNGWPPRPILVSGSAIPGAVVGAEPPKPASVQPLELGRAVFQDPQFGCAACHSLSKGVNLVCPTLSDIATRAAVTVMSAEYGGKATDAASFIRESVTQPNAYIVPGPTYSSNGQSIMPADIEKRMKPEQLDDLVQFLMSHK